MKRKGVLLVLILVIILIITSCSPNNKVVEIQEDLVINEDISKGKDVSREVVVINNKEYYLIDDNYTPLNELEEIYLNRDGGLDDIFKEKGFTHILILNNKSGNYNKYILSENMKANNNDYNLNNVSDWAKKDIVNLLDKDIIPDSVINDYKRDITREEFTELILNLYIYINPEEGIPEIARVFNDTDNSKVSTAASLGLVNGLSSVEFGPDLNLTREQAATIIFNLFSKFNVQPTGMSKVFADNEEISNWAYDGIQNMYHAEILKGDNENNILPKNNITVEESIVLVSRAYTLFTINNSI